MRFCSQPPPSSACGLSRFGFPGVHPVACRTKTGRDLPLHGSDGSSRHQHAGGSAAGGSVAPQPSMKILSIVIPAYNEERFIGTLLERIRAVDLRVLDVDREI